MNKVWDTWTPLKPSQESCSIHFPSITGLQTRHGADYADYGGRSNDLVIYTCTVSASMSSSPPVHGARVIGTKKLGPWLKYLQQKYQGISKNHIFHDISSYFVISTSRCSFGSTVTEGTLGSTPQPASRSSMMSPLQDGLWSWSMAIGIAWNSLE